MIKNSNKIFESMFGYSSDALNLKTKHLKEISFIAWLKALLVLKISKFKNYIYTRQHHQLNQ